MNAIEKLDKIFRRLRRKNRRATTRRVRKQSSSGSDENNLTAQQTDNSKNDRKIGNNCRPHLKPITPSVTTTIVTRQPSVSEKYFLTVMGFQVYRSDTSMFIRYLIIYRKNWKEQVTYSNSKISSTTTRSPTRIGNRKLRKSLMLKY